MLGEPDPQATLARVLPFLQKHWGYDQLRPLQDDAMACVLGQRDSLVVLPTGGGKSLCFQAPAVAMDGLGVVLSPLISLMKDQVDSLTSCGVPAAMWNSSMSPDEKRLVGDDLRAGKLKLLYLSPERLAMGSMLDMLGRSNVAFFAIDEAHCISDWGHDFRPEYRSLALLRQSFPNVAIHAYTATATEKVRKDIVTALALRDPRILVGSFDRPNLTFRVQQRTDLLPQVCEVIDKHPGESGIVYCIRRTDVEELCKSLRKRGYRARPYHAGLSDEDRRSNQEAFIREKTDIIVATVAFGMGIDKSNVRYVIHAGAPKAVEAYQQESGRAGRDGLDAECHLFYSAGDFQTWRRLQSNLESPAREIAMTTLAGIERFCAGVTCRHRALVEYFGQSLENENCASCDVCLSEIDLVDDPIIVGQKILSCVLRLSQNFGAEYTAQVLVGSKEQRILANGHDRLSTWGLLAADGKIAVRRWIDQLAAEGYLVKDGELATLRVTETGRKLLKGLVTPRLSKPVTTRGSRKEGRASRESRQAPAQSWDGVDRGLFEALRALRREKAAERNLPAFVVFGDATLRDMARRRPSTLNGLLHVHGVGEKKNADYGQEFLDAITAYSRGNELPMDITT